MKRYNIIVNGVAYDVSVEETDGQTLATPVVSAPAPAAVAPATAKAAPAAAPAVTGGTQIKAPMPGSILDIKASAGSSVKKGQVILVLEAMKMENDIVAPVDGTLTSVNVEKGVSVSSDQILAVIS
ncbi:MAG: acetyl-CoA carboxylase biotin carboxyl carrier protein subunit [Ruminococcus sp.]|jgi:biotin carboxyl carrier protein|nr:acetyl-CoA carboxylase biotin carboxyl carrier protein subunit [Ruminococcus sp.]